MNQTEWQPISTAPKDVTEFIGCKIYEGKLLDAPILSFWSPTLNRFYCNPTHWIPLPLIPDEQTHP